MKSLKDFVLEAKKENTGHREYLYLDKDGKKNNLSKEAKDKLANTYITLVDPIVKYFYKNGFKDKELKDVGYYSLAMAIEYYDKNRLDDKGISGRTFEEKLKSYFGKYIKLGICDYLRNDSRLVRIPASQQAKQKGLLTKLETESIDQIIDINNSNDEDDNQKKVDDKLVYKDDDLEIRDIDKLANEVSDKIYDDISKKFKDYEVEIFCKALGWKPHSKEPYNPIDHKVKGKDLAAQYGKTPGAITEIVKRVRLYINNNFKKEYSKIISLYAEDFIIQPLMDIINENMEN